MKQIVVVTRHLHKHKINMTFKLKSGNKISFKDMGSSPAKQVHEQTHDTIKTKVDPDAPGTPGQPGYEPPVRRSDFDEGSEQQKMFDRNQAKSKAKKNRPEPTWPGTDEYRKPEDIPAEEYEKRGIKKYPIEKPKKSPAKQGVIWGPKGSERMMDAFGDETPTQKQRREKSYRKRGESKFQADVRRGKEQRKYEKNLSKHTRRKFDSVKMKSAIEAAMEKKSPAKQKNTATSMEQKHKERVEKVFFAEPKKPKARKTYQQRKEELLNQGFTQKDADQMIKHGATTGEYGATNDKIASAKPRKKK